LIGTLSILQGRLSVAEAKLVSTLTWLGLIFIPLSFSTTIFSMSGDFQPGGTRFWVYFAVAFPMLCLVLTFTFLISWALRRPSQRDYQSYSRWSGKRSSHTVANIPKAMDDDKQAAEVLSQVHERVVEVC